jgi:hypothetical protein
MSVIKIKLRTLTGTYKLDEISGMSAIEIRLKTSIGTHFLDGISVACQ